MKKDSVIKFERHRVKVKQFFLTAGLIRAFNVLMHALTTHQGKRGFHVSHIYLILESFFSPMSVSQD